MVCKSYLAKSQFEDEPAHLCGSGGGGAHRAHAPVDHGAHGPAHRDGARLLEALQVVRREDEEPLLPPGEDLVPLLPQDALADGGAGANGARNGAVGAQDRGDVGGGLENVVVGGGEVVEVADLGDGLAELGVGAFDVVVGAEKVGRLKR